LSVAFVCPGWPLNAFPNGVVSYIAAMVEELRRGGHSASVLAGKVAGDQDRSELADRGVFGLGFEHGNSGLVGRLVDRLWNQFDRRGAIDRRQARAILNVTRRLAETPGPHILEMEEAFGWPLLVSPRCPMPVVVRLHGPWFLNGPNNGADPASPEFGRRVRKEGLAMASARAITAPSRDVLERSRAYYGLALEGAEVIPNATPQIPEADRWRREGSDPDRILFIGRFDLHKGGDTIIDAFARLQHDRPSARLTFVGPDRGLVRDGRPWNLEAYIEHRLPGALRDGRVEWLGQRPNAELNGLRRRAAVTVSPSRDENFPMAIIEAMAVGCPIVAARAGGAAEAFEHETHGLYVRPADPADLAAALSRMLADPARAAAMGSAAAEHCRRNYSPEVVAEQTVCFYRRVLAKGATQGALMRKESRP
jgi:glycosyltransferase involved in cell wall biosynthesis